MKRPAFQFYPADWRNNAKLRRCSEAARGVWMDILCVLHDSDEYGVCRWPLVDLARASGAPIKLVRELVSKDVLKGADAGAPPYVYTPRHAGKDGEPVTLVTADAGACWYCSRFVRDEWVRQRRGSATQFTPDNQPPKGAPKHPPKGGIGERQGDGSTSSSSSTSKAIPSEANASGAKAPVVDGRDESRNPKDTVFALGISLLTAAGVKESNARSFLAMQCKGGRDAEVAAALEACAVEKPIQPIPWLQTRLNPKAATTGKHSGFASKDYRAGVTEDGSFA